MEWGSERATDRSLEVHRNPQKPPDTRRTPQRKRPTESGWPLSIGGLESEPTEFLLDGGSDLRMFAEPENAPARGGNRSDPYGRRLHFILPPFPGCVSWVGRLPQKYLLLLGNILPKRIGTASDRYLLPVLRRKVSTGEILAAAGIRPGRTGIQWFDQSNGYSRPDGLLARRQYGVRNHGHGEFERDQQGPG